MAYAIPFVRDMDFVYEEAQQVSPLVRRLVANNPGPFTYKGTGVYIVGSGDVAIVDPGPDNTEHIDAILRAVEGERVTHILITHQHMDHSPGALPLAERTGAKIYASQIPSRPSDCDALRLEASDDHGFKSDIDVKDGDRFMGPGWTIEAVFTPGHTINHMAYALIEENALFPGDHIMGWSTTIIGPPDGDMTEYLASLAKVRDRNFSTLWPTHGPPVTDVRTFVQAYIDHRMAREAAIIEQMRAGKTAIKDMVSVIYADVDKRLHPAACHSVLAHMIRLVELGRVETMGRPCVDSVYALKD